MEVGEESGWKKIHTVCLLGLTFEMSMVFGDLYILGMHLSPDLFLTLPTSEVFAYVGPKCTRGTSAHLLARRGYFGVFWGIWVCEWCVGVILAIPISGARTSGRGDTLDRQGTTLKAKVVNIKSYHWKQVRNAASQWTAIFARRLNAFTRRPNLPVFIGK